MSSITEKPPQNNCTSCNHVHQRVVRDVTTAKEHINFECWRDPPTPFPVFNERGVIVRLVSACAPVSSKTTCGSHTPGGPGYVELELVQSEKQLALPPNARAPRGH